MAAETLYREGQLSVREIVDKLHIAKSTLYVSLRARDVAIRHYQARAVQEVATPPRRRTRVS